MFHCHVWLPDGIVNGLLCYQWTIPSNHSSPLGNNLDGQIKTQCRLDDIQWGNPHIIYGARAHYIGWWLIISPKTCMALLKKKTYPMFKKTFRNFEYQIITLNHASKTWRNKCRLHPCCVGEWPLVNIQQTMENHHSKWDNPLFLWPFLIATFNHQTGVLTIPWGSIPEFSQRWKLHNLLAMAPLGGRPSVEQAPFGPNYTHW